MIKVASEFIEEEIFKRKSEITQWIKVFAPMISKWRI
jgi:hypothetical protein